MKGLKNLNLHSLQKFLHTSNLRITFFLFKKKLTKAAPITFDLSVYKSEQLIFS